jgi:hypothetical protein
MFIPVWHSETARSAHTAVFMCFVWIWKQTAIISLYSINWLVVITETGCLSSFRLEVNENCALLGHYAASVGNSIPTFRDNPSIRPARVKDVLGFLTVADGPLGCPATSVRNCHYSTRNGPEESNSRDFFFYTLKYSSDLSQPFRYKTPYDDRCALFNSHRNC